MLWMRLHFLGSGTGLPLDGLEGLPEVLKVQLKVSFMGQKVIKVNHASVPRDVSQYPFHQNLHCGRDIAEAVT